MYQRIDTDSGKPISDAIMNHLKARACMNERDKALKSYESSILHKSERSSAELKACEDLSPLKALSLIREIEPRETIFRLKEESLGMH